MGNIKVRLLVGVFAIMIAEVLSCNRVSACWNPPPPACPQPCTSWDPIKEECINWCCPCMGCVPGVGCYDDCVLEEDEQCCCSSDNSKGECCKIDEDCCDGTCCPNHKCCVDGDCIEGGCRPTFDLVESGECGCYAFECEGSITQTWVWYCEEYDGGCPAGTECKQTGTVLCYTTRTKDCTGECLVYGSECAFGNWEYGPKALRCLCGCCP